MALPILPSVFFFLFHILLSSSSSSSNSPLCHPSQSVALLQLKSHFLNESVYSNGPLTNSWIEGTDCCSWEGVECDESTGYVIGLDLYDLRGQIPSSSSLFQLSHLQTLSLLLNDFNGSPLPPELGRLINLTHLDITYSNFSGVIPSQISHLSNLISLSISDNFVFDSHTFDALSKNLTSLQSLSLRYLNMSAVNVKSFLNFSSSLEELCLKDCLLTGKFPVDDLRFVNLTSLEVSHNPDLTTSLPESNWSLPLKSLTLSNTNFSAPHFYSGWNLKSLNHLVLENCSLRGEVPTFLSNLKQLTELYLDSNKLTGSIPFWLFNLSSLISLSLSNNHLSGQIPHFHSKSLVYLFLRQNLLSGPIPASMFQLPNLSSLSLSSNNFFFGVKELEPFQNLKSLRELGLSNNNLSISTLNTVDLDLPKLYYLDLSSCNINEFPFFLRKQDKLGWLDLSNNNISGDIPPCMIHVGKETLIYLNLSHNHFTGAFHLPWKNLQYVDLHSNMLQGLLPIPPPDLIYISFSENRFSGELSSLICNMSSLQVLDVSHNNLSGTIPSCLRSLSTSLLVLNLRRNHLHGTIPTIDAKECALSNLNLQGNQLEGAIPSSLVNCKGLEVIDLGHNKINDEFPQWLESLPMLRALILSSNKLHGHLPSFESNNSFPKLQVLDLSDNALCGSLPNFQNFRAMVNVDDNASTYLGTSTIESAMRNYDYSVTLSIKGFTIEMQKIFHVFASIDLSNNAFEGEIPVNIGELLSLKGFNLSHNNLCSNIPPSIGSLKNLEWLDLSSNKLVGEIPAQFLDIGGLAILNVSNNQLAGHIPEGKQFNTFTVDSYRGNLGLCGYPLQRKCGDEESEPPLTSMEFDSSSLFDDGFGWEAVMAGYGSGMIIGVGMGCLMYRYRRLQWLLFIIEDKLRLRPKSTANSRRTRARRC